MNMKPLTSVPPGKNVIVRRVNGGAEFCQHLETLGFIVGGEVTVITEAGGNLVVNVKQSRLAISRETAKFILVDARAETMGRTAL
ncbi:MAG: ferrous iron transport protein A [Desulfovibrio sp.]|jgi:ferrous iron transport protein A|nr:ferrous iron transport protein A [Desulfovibrio sp.]